MIINRIIFYNFMAYYNEAEFEFNPSEERNVSIIYAPNDVGKSCFFKGIFFNLYGAQRGKNLKDLININAFKEGIYDSYVSITGIHNDKQVKITRQIHTKGDIHSIPKSTDFIEELTIWENGTELVIGSSEEKYDYINAIVHEEAAKYFFFDGEKIEAYNIANAGDYKEAITRILGIKEIENAQEDFEKIEDDFEKDRDKILEEQKEASKVISDKKEIENEIDMFNRDLKDYEDELKNIKSRIIKLEGELKQHEDIKEKIEEKQRLRNEEDQLNHAIKEVEKKKIGLFKNNGTIILGCKIADDIRRNLKDNESEILKASLSESLKIFLEDLKKQNECICGNSIGAKEVDNINNYIINSFKQNDDMKKEIERRQAFREIDSYIQFAADAKKSYLDLAHEKVKLSKRLYNVQDQLIILKKDIGNYDEDAGERIIMEVSRLESKEKEYTAKVIEISTKISIKRKELEEKEKELSKFSSTNKRCSIAEKKLRLAETVKTIFIEYLEELIKLKKVEVEQKASAIFMQLTNKPTKYKGLIVTDDYTLKLELTDGTQYEILKDRTLNPSTGQSKIISLSYIAGINQSSNSIAPVIIDNPVGLFSKEHKLKVLQYLPRFGKQVIFMVTKADLSEEFRNIIAPYVNCEYYLVDKTDQTWPKTTIAEKEDCYGVSNI